jgi:hypothetical protein
MNRIVRARDCDPGAHVIGAACLDRLSRRDPALPSPKPGRTTP